MNAFSEVVMVGCGNADAVTTDAVTTDAAADAEEAAAEVPS